MSNYCVRPNFQSVEAMRRAMEIGMFVFVREINPIRPGYMSVSDGPAVVHGMGSDGTILWTSSVVIRNGRVSEILPEPAPVEPEEPKPRVLFGATTLLSLSMWSALTCLVCFRNTAWVNWAYAWMFASAGLLLAGYAMAWRGRW